MKEDNNIKDRLKGKKLKKSFTWSICTVNVALDLDFFAKSQDQIWNGWSRSVRTSALK